MKLYILRHGDAVEHGDPRYSEDDRPLTPKGLRRTKQLAHALRKLDIHFGAILSSPLVRARQTADIVAKGSLQKVILSGALKPSGSMKSLVDDLNAIRPAPDSVMLVGHEPYLSGLISLLCVGGPDLPIQLKKGALCRLEVDHLTCGKCATLEWLLQPRVIGQEL